MRQDGGCDVAQDRPTRIPTVDQMETKDVLVHLTTEVYLLVCINYRGLNSDTLEQYKVYRMGPQQAYEYSLSKLMFGVGARKYFFRKWWPKPIYYDAFGPYDEYGRIMV